MRRRSPLELALASEERSHLEHLLRCTTTPFGLARRAGIVLSFAAGTTIRRIAIEQGMARQHVRTWIQRFVEKRLDGLEDLPRSGRPPVFSPGRGDPSGQARLRATG